VSAMENRKTTDHSGSTFDSFLEEEGIREEVETVAIKRVLMWRVNQARQEHHKDK
jgi:antitoxin HicB